MSEFLVDGAPKRTDKLASRRRQLNTQSDKHCQSLISLRARKHKTTILSDYNFSKAVLDVHPQQTNNYYSSSLHKLCSKIQKYEKLAIFPLFSESGIV